MNDLGQLEWTGAIGIVYNLWAEVLDKTKGEGQAHIDYQEHLSKGVTELGGNPRATFGEMDDTEAGRFIIAMREWLDKEATE